MSLKLGGVELLNMKHNGDPLLDAKINGAALWPVTPVQPTAAVPLTGRLTAALTVSADAPIDITGNLYGRMKARSSRQTITHFKSVEVAEAIKYRVWPVSYAEGVIGELLAEAAPYSAITPEISRVPLVRGFEVIRSGSAGDPVDQVRLRQATGDNTIYDGGAGNDGGVNTGSAAYNWQDYVGTQMSGSAAIYIMDVTSRNWMRIFPQVRNGGTAGGSFFNFFMKTADHAGAVTSSFDVSGSTDNAAKLVKIQTWLGEMRADTAKREMVIMIAAEHNLVPVF